MLLNTAHYVDIFGGSNISDHYDITFRRNIELAIWYFVDQAYFELSPQYICYRRLGFTTAGDDDIVYPGPSSLILQTTTSWGSISQKSIISPQSFSAVFWELRFNYQALEASVLWSLAYRSLGYIYGSTDHYIPIQINAHWMVSKHSHWFLGFLTLSWILQIKKLLHQ